MYASRDIHTPATLALPPFQISEAELEEASCAMGYGAVKYADLKNHRTTNYKFSFDDMLSLKGNTAVYLLYAHARISGEGGWGCRSVLSRSAIVVPGACQGHRLTLKRLHARPQRFTW